MGVYKFGCLSTLGVYQPSTSGMIGSGETRLTGMNEPHTLATPCSGAVDHPSAPPCALCMRGVPPVCLSVRRPIASTHARTQASLYLRET
eukprot:5907768-Prymnesium_polylepis.1